MNSVDLCYCSKCGCVPKLTIGPGGTWTAECVTPGCQDAFVQIHDRSAAIMRWNVKYGKKPEPESKPAAEASPSVDPVIKKDWRIGLKVKPKFRAHVLFGCEGTIVEVHPDGFRGKSDPNGILIIHMGGVHDFEVCQGANEWVTA